MALKEYFSGPTAAKIMKLSHTNEIYEDLIKNISSLKTSEAAIIKVSLIPQEYNNRKFMKHGDELYIPRINSTRESLERKLTPVQERAIVFDSKSPNPVSSYSFKPFLGTDKRTRKVSLVECVEGAKLFSYSSKSPSTAINVKPYDNSKRVEMDGAEIIVGVPSRTKKQERYKFKISSVPVIDSNYKWGMVNNISTDHQCGSKRFNIRYTYSEEKETSKVFNFCAHDIAGYLKIMDHYWNKDKNLVPLQMNQFAIPTQETANFYNKLSKNCLIQISEDKKPRKLNRSEKEILLWGLVHKLGHDKTFFAKEKLKDYNWEGEE